MGLGRTISRRGGPWIARKVADASDEELERVLRHRPAGAVLLWGIFTGMPHRVRPGARLEASIEWRVARARGRTLVRRLEFGGGDAWVRRPRDGDPPADLVLALDDAAFLRLAAGDRSVTWLVLRGRLRVEGSRLLAARLLLNLDPPVPSPADDG